MLNLFLGIGMKKFFLMLLVVIVYNSNSQSLYFSGPTKYVEIGNLGITGHQLTLEAIVSINIDNALQLPILSKHGGSQNCNYYFKPTGAGITTTSGFYFVVNPDFLNKQFKINKCYHVAITYDGQKLKFLINGCVVDEALANGDLIQNDYITRIGQYAAMLNDTNQYYGYIDELRLWNVARTEDEIKNNMNDLPNPNSQPGLLAYYKFENGGNPYTNFLGDTRWDGKPYGSPDIQNNPFCSEPLIPFDISKIDVINESGSNAKDGKIIINTNNSNNALYSLDGNNYQMNNSFDNLPSGDYTIYVKYGDCVKTASVVIHKKPYYKYNMDRKSKQMA